MKIYLKHGFEGIKVPGARVQGSAFRVQSARFKVQNAWFKVQGSK
jgi:hypothetical protein